MIYQKKNAQIDCTAEIFPKKERGLSHSTDSVKQYSRQEIAPYVLPPISKRKIKRTGRRQRKKHSFAKLVLVCFTILFCTATLDQKYNGGRLINLALNYAQEKITDYTDKKINTETNSNLYTSLQLPKTQFSQDEQITLPINKQELQQLQTNQNTTEDTDCTAVSVSSSEQIPLGADGEIFYPITKADLSATAVTSLNNETIYEPDTHKIFESYPDALTSYEINPDEPLVLIVHTHACESYTEYENMYPNSENTRTENTDKNVVRVGKEIAHTLESYGINTIHCRSLCDKESFINAYNTSHDIVEEYLEKYPSIRIVIDVHRDAIIRQSGESIKPAVTIAGQEYAQLMFVVGTGQSAHSHPYWEQNLSLAMCVQNEAEKRYAGLFRPVNLRSVPFNQWLSTGYLLLEVGSSANNLDEALASAQAFGHVLSAVLNTNSLN